MHNNIHNNDLGEFLRNILFDETLLDDHQYHQLANQISVLRKIKNIENKFKEVSNKQKLAPVLSELNFVYEFARLGFEIELIYDGHKRFICKKNKIKSPDFIALNGNDEYFIEVTKLTTSNPNEELIKHLEQKIKNYPVWFWVHFSEEYSTPCMSSEDWNLFQERIKDLSDKIQKILPDHKFWNSSLEINGCTVYFNPLTENEQGFIGGCVYGYLLPSEKIYSHVEKRLVDKSKESLSWSTSTLNNPRFYLLALDLEEFTSFPYGLLHLLYGKITYYSKEHFGARKPKFYYKVQEFLETEDFQSLDKRLKDFLLNVGFDINKEAMVNNLGIFIDKEIRDKFSNVTGVLIKSHDSYQYLPNPFSKKNGSELIDFFNFPIIPETFEKYLGRK